MAKSTESSQSPPYRLNLPPADSRRLGLDVDAEESLVLADEPVDLDEEGGADESGLLSSGPRDADSDFHRDWRGRVRQRYERAVRRGWMRSGASLAVRSEIAEAIGAVAAWAQLARPTKMAPRNTCAYREAELEDGHSATASFAVLTTPWESGRVFRRCGMAAQAAGRDVTETLPCAATGVDLIRRSRLMGCGGIPGIVMAGSKTFEYLGVRDSLAWAYRLIVSPVLLEEALAVLAFESRDQGCEWAAGAVALRAADE